MDGEQYILMSIDNLDWTADFTAYDNFATARANMKKQFDRDLKIALDKMGISHPEEIVYEDYSEQFTVKETYDSLHVRFVSGDFCDDIYHYEIKPLSTMKPFVDDGATYIRNEDGTWSKVFENE